MDSYVTQQDKIHEVMACLMNGRAFATVAGNLYPQYEKQLYALAERLKGEIELLKSIENEMQSK